MRGHKSILMIVLVAGLGVMTLRAVEIANTQTGAKPASASDTPRLEHQTFTLPNGLEVILSEDHRLPMVAVNLWYHVGPANEDAGTHRLRAPLRAHDVPGLEARRRPTRTSSCSRPRARSDINGTTDFDRTNYFETVPSNQLELALWLESDRMGYLLDVVDQKALANQQDVVRNERRQSVENQPYGIAEEALFHTLFPEGASVLRHRHRIARRHPGREARRRAAVLQAVLRAEQRQPRDRRRLRHRGRDARWSRSTSGRSSAVPTFRRSRQRRRRSRPRSGATVTDTVELPRVYMSWLTPPIFKPGDAEADVAADVLGGGKSSRLFKTLVYDKQIAQSITASQESLILGSKFTIEATARPGHTAEELEAAINDELRTLRGKGPDRQRARAGAEHASKPGSSRDWKRLAASAAKADRLNSYEHYLGTPDYLGKDLQRYRDATPQALKAFAERYLQPNARVVVFALPGDKKLVSEPPPATAQGASGGAQSVNADEPWRQTMPKPGPVKAAQLPTPERFVLPNGLTVIMSEHRELPVVSAALVFASGSGDNPPDKPGFANFTAAMLDEGTSTRNALGIADEAARLGATLATGSAMDRSSGVRDVARQAVPGGPRADGGRGGPSDVSGRRSRAPAGEPARQSRRRKEQSRAGRLARHGVRVVRPGSPVRLRRARHRGVQ